MRGLELLDGGAVAVLIDDNGQVKTRFSATNADLGAAAAAALEKVDGFDGPLGVAVFNPDAAAVSAALKSLDRRADAKRRHVVASGVAAAVAEAWTGAGRGVNDVVFRRYRACGGQRPATAPR